MSADPKSYQNFCLQIAAGNMNRAFNCLFNQHNTEPQPGAYYWADASRIFLDCVSRGAYHSAAVCQTIRNRLIQHVMLSRQQKDVLHNLDIPVIRHPGILIPCVTEEGDGILFYAVSGRCREYLLDHLDKRYEILEPDRQFLKVVDHISGKLKRDYQLALDHPGINFYCLCAPVLNRKTVYTVTTWNSAALGAALVLACDTPIPYAMTDNKTFPKAATGVFCENRFYLPEKILQKRRLIEDECPEIAVIATGTGAVPCTGTDIPRLETLTDIPALVLNAADMIRAHPPDGDILGELQRNLTGIKDSETCWRHILALDKLYDLCALPLTRTDENEYFLPTLLLTCFDTARHTFRFEDALRFAAKIEQHLNDNPKFFSVERSEFHAKCAVLHTALYQHKMSSQYRNHKDLGFLDSDRRTLYTILFAECAILAGHYGDAEAWLDRGQTFVTPRTSGRLKIYRYRLQMNRNISVTPEHPDSLDIAAVYKKSDMPYLYYVTARSLYLKGQYQEALAIVNQADAVYSGQIESIWPGILWRRYGGRAAEALQNYTAAEALLTRPLPEEYTDRFILQVHIAASRLLFWSMRLTRDDHVTAGSPEPITAPLLHHLIRHHFEKDLETLIELWKSRAPASTIRDRVEVIVRNAYE
jgi:tetratricopeptide (TPR) repeat protein